MPKNHFQILHLSDLHISEDKQFDQSLVFDPLLERLKKDADKGLKPEIVLVTGDIVYHGIASEYKQAKSFFDRMLGCLKLDNGRLFIVPGNHDVNRKKYRKSELLHYENMTDLNEELENPEYRQDLLKGMKEYYDFIHKQYPHLKSVYDNLIPFVHLHPSQCGKKVGIVGLNSAWMSRKSPDREDVAIGEYQVKKAVTELRKKGKPDILLFCFHHPLNWLWEKDQERNIKYFSKSILLTGHLHKTKSVYSYDQDGDRYEFQAGGLYLGSESIHPHGYHYITVDFNEKNTKLDFRTFDKDHGKW